MMYPGKRPRLTLMKETTINSEPAVTEILNQPDKAAKLVNPHFLTNL